MPEPKPMSAKRVAEVGRQIYEERLRPRLEPRYVGKIVAIDAESGNYFLGNTLHEAIQAGRKKYPDKVFYCVKVGFPAVYSFTSGATVSMTSKL